MRRYTLLVLGSMALSALSLVPVLLREAAAADKPAPSALPAVGAKSKPATVPEDGSGAEDFPASSRLIRDILQTRQSEDLIICVAGCRPGNDRVVYAQPADPKAVPAVAAAQPDPASTTGPQAAPVAQKTPADKPSEAAAAEPAKVDNAENKPSGGSPENAAADQAPVATSGDVEAAAHAKPEGGEEGRMVPTAAQPEPASEEAPEGEANSSDEAPKGE